MTPETNFNLRVVQACIGKFHHFHLARELHAAGELEAIYCGYPWFKLKHEGIPRALVRTYPWLQAPFMAPATQPLIVRFPSLKREWEWRSVSSFDRYVARTVPPCNVFIGLSGSGLGGGRKAQTLGAKYICDRSSSHIRYQNRLLAEEHERWGLPWRGIDPRIIEKETAEYAQADKISVPSEFVRQSFIKEGVAAERVVKIPFGANMHRFSPQGTPDPDKFVVLFVGQLTIRKGIPDLLEAFQNFQHPRKELWIVGRRRPEVDALLAQYNPTGVSWKGVIPNQELARMYSQANVFVLPSLEEGLAYVQGEALACGCPVIGTDHTGAADLFTDGREGFIVPIRNPEAITERLTQLADQPQLRAAMSAAGLERVKSMGGWQTYGEQYRNMLHTLVGTNTAI